MEKVVVCWDPSVLPSVDNALPGEGRAAMKISDMIREAMEKKGFQTLKEASRTIGISPELLRVTINKGHMPKDNTLIQIADKLDMDKAILILAAHQQKVPAEVKGFFLSPTHAKLRRGGKRVFPLSEEQCNYLAKIMKPEEIQLIRKFRQVSEEGKTQILGYVDFMFATRRSEGGDSAHHQLSKAFVPEKQSRTDSRLRAER
jgi:hypothetical protein